MTLDVSPTGESRTAYKTVTEHGRSKLRAVIVQTFPAVTGFREEVTGYRIRVERVPTGGGKAETTFVQAFARHHDADDGRYFRPGEYDEAWCYHDPDGSPAYTGASDLGHEVFRWSTEEPVDVVDSILTDVLNHAERLF